MSPTRIALSFGRNCIEIDATIADRRGGLRAFAREAENQWGLRPNTFSFTGSSGKIDSIATLQRELVAASSGVIKIEVHERPEAMIRREMHAAVQASEDRMLARLEASIASVRSDMQRIDTKVSSVLAPMVQSLALEQMDRQQSDKRLSGALAPMVQCIALEQMELRNKIDQLEGGASASQDCCIEEETEEWDIDDNVFLSCAAPNAGQVPMCNIHATGGMKSLKVVENELDQECAVEAACDLEMSTQVDIESLRIEVGRLDKTPKPSEKAPKPSAEGAATSAAQAPQKESYQMPAQSKPTDSYSGVSDSWMSFAQPPIVGFAYSSKGIVAPASLPLGRQRGMWAGLQASSDDGAPFSQCVIAPHLRAAGESWGSRSMPILAPLQ